MFICESLVLNSSHITIMSSSVKEKVEDYFASMNTTSRRMMSDIKTLRQKHGSDWDAMNSDQQSEIIWKYIVTPDAIKMYENEPVNKADVESFPVLRLRPGAKIIVEEDNASTKSFGNSWRDEHSAPFRWETLSQLGLDEGENSEKELENSAKSIGILKDSQNIAASEKNEQKKEEEVKRPATVKRPEVPPPPVPPHSPSPIPPHAPSLVPHAPSPVPPHAPSPVPPNAPSLVPPHAPAVVPPNCEQPPALLKHFEKNDTPIYAKVVKRKSISKTLAISDMKAHRKAKEEMKPAVPPRASLELKGSVDVKKYKTLPIDFDDIPKTGFDFLDNW